MIKKVVIPAAGQGVRMGDLTKEKPKHLLEVQGKPFLYYLITNILEAGYKNLILVTGFRADLMEEFVQNFGFHPYVTLINQYEILGPKEKIYGTLCPLMVAKEVLTKESFLVVNGDNLYSVRDLASLNVEDGHCWVVGRIEKDCPEKYGIIIKDENDFLKKIIEKPKNPIGNLVTTGLYKFTPDVFEVISKVKISVRGEYEITDALTLLAQKKLVKVHLLRDFWFDFGCPQDIPRVAAFLQDYDSLSGSGN